MLLGNFACRPPSSRPLCFPLDSQSGIPTPVSSLKISAFGEICSEIFLFFPILWPLRYASSYLACNPALSRKPNKPRRMQPTNGGGGAPKSSHDPDPGNCG